jgi:hypothetical protein
MSHLPTRKSWCPALPDLAGLPQDRGVQVRVFSQSRWEHPRRSNTLNWVWVWQEEICPGRHFVDATIVLVISSVLSVSKVTKYENGRGSPLMATVPVDRGVLV